MSTRRTSPNRRTFLYSAAAASLLIVAGARGQTGWPDRAVKIIVPYPAGGSTDVLHSLRAIQCHVRPALCHRKPPGRRWQYRHRRRHHEHAGRLHRVGSDLLHRVAFADKERARWKDVVALSGLTPQ